jgi:4-hydroxy-2-oxoheptanedioate aldolase
VVVQIEDPAGVHAAGDIAGVAGVDAIVVGAADLSFELGEPLDFDTPPLRSAIDIVRGACRRAGTQFGVAGLPPGAAMRADADIVVAGVDVRLIDAALASAVGALREVVHG